MATIKREDTKSSIWFRAFVNEKQVGSVEYYRLSWGHYRIRMIYVNEKYKRLGIGTALLDAGKEIAEELTAGCLKDKIDFYLKCGFKIFNSNRTGYEILWSHP